MLNILNGNIRISYLAFLFFILAYPFYLVSVGFNIGENFNLIYYSIITGLCFFFSSYIFFHKNIFSYIFIFLLLFSLFLTISSEYYNYLDLINFLRFLGYFSVGCLFFDVIKKNEFNKIFYIILFSICVSFTFFFDFSQGNYLYYADSIVALSFLIISIFKDNKLICLLVFLATIISLYFINSRSSIIFFFISFIIVFFYINGFKKTFIIISPLLISISSFLVYLNNNLDNYQGHRLLRLIFDRESDTSLSARLIVNEFGKETFLKNSFTGDFGAYRPIYGDGLYAHNFYSFLAEFGIIGLIFLFYIIAIFLFSIYFIFNNRLSIRRENVFLLMCLIYSMLGLFLSKSYVWLFLYFTIGLAVSFVNCHFKNGSKVSF